jgi:hypothetical protein
MSYRQIFRTFKISRATMRLAVMLSVRYPLPLWTAVDIFQKCTATAWCICICGSSFDVSWPGKPTENGMIKCAQWQVPGRAPEDAWIQEPCLGALSPASARSALSVLREEAQLNGSSPRGVCQALGSKPSRH